MSTDVISQDIYQNHIAQTRNQHPRKEGNKRNLTKTQIHVTPTQDELSTSLLALKLSPSSSISTSSNSSNDKENTQRVSKQTRKLSRKKSNQCQNNQLDEEIAARPLNDNEMSMWNSLVAGLPQSVNPEVNSVSPSKTAPSNQNKLKKNKTTNDPSDKRDFLFGGLPPHLRIQLQLDDVAQYSVTDMKTAARISSFLMSLDGITPDCIITDATACVGGNTSSFCTFFRYVQAIEIDTTRFQMLVHNVHSVMTFVNIQCFCANYVDVAQFFSQDVVFIDPPWGGPEYRLRSTVDLHLGETPLASVCELLIGRTQYVVIKVPENFDLEKFTAHVSGVVGFITSFRKMGLVVVDYRYVHAPYINEL